MRGGLDDALDKLARRDELRRRAAGEAPGTPPAVTELMEAIAAVVARNPAMGVTVGVEGAGDPLLLHFYFADGQVQVNADNVIGAQSPAEAATARHADFEINLDDEAEVAQTEPVTPTPIQPARVQSTPVQPQPAQPVQPQPVQPQPVQPQPVPGVPLGEHRRAADDDRHRFAAAASGYGRDERRYAEPETAERPYESYARPSDTADPRYAATDAVESSPDLGARLRDLGMARSHPADYPRHPFAATPPPEVPLQTPTAPQAAAPQPPAPPAGPKAARVTPPPRRPTVPMPPDRGYPDRAAPGYAESTRRIHPEQYTAPTEPSAAERIPAQTPGQPVGAQPRGSYPVSSESPGAYQGSPQPGGPYTGSGHPASGHPTSGHAGSGHPGSANPGSANPGSANPGGANPGGANPGGANPGGPRPGNPYQEKPTVARPYPRHADLYPPGDPNGDANPGGQPGGLPKPLARPIPLQAERPEDTEMAARRVAALLRNDPSLLNQPPE
ncbi:MAG TPA: hypothetical protein VGB74_00270 [Actinoplanes sp.]